MIPLADIVLVIHVLWVGFIVVSIPLIIVGAFLGWRWIRNRWYRRIHVTMMALVVVETVFGLACPLTLWEDSLRREAGQQGYSADGFVSHFVRQLLYYDFEPWVFGVAYVSVLGLILALYYFIPPRKA